MRISNAEHEAHRWLIALIAPDFELLDAWRLPARGAREDFATLIEIVGSRDPARGSSSRATRLLFSVRRRLGALLGWDDSGAALPIPGCSETSLRVRVPEELLDSTTPPIAVSSSTFVPLYRTDEEWAAEISNGTVHAVLQLGWVEEAAGSFSGRMGVYVKPRGRLGAVYMALIGPFRHLIVYPALMRQIERTWLARMPGAVPEELTVLYDGDCGFCRVVLAILLTWDHGERLRPAAIQSARGEALLIDLAHRDRLASWHLIDAQGARHSGGAGLPQVLEALPRGAPLARLASLSPALTARLYGWVAGHRVQLGRVFGSRSRAWAARVIDGRERR